MAARRFFLRRKCPGIKGLEDRPRPDVNVRRGYCVFRGDWYTLFRQLGGGALRTFDGERGMIRSSIASALMTGIVALSAGAQSGTLRIGAPTVEENRYTFPIVLGGGQGEVSALDFRLRFDPDVFRPVSATSGAAAQAYSKLVRANVPSPGEYIVVMMGFNDLGIASGEVARIILERRPDAGAAETRLSITGLNLANGAGRELASEGSSRLVAFNEKAPEEETDGTDEADASAGDSEDAQGDTEARKPGQREERSDAALAPGALAGSGPVSAVAAIRETAAAIRKNTDEAARVRASIPTPGTQPSLGGGDSGEILGAAPVRAKTPNGASGEPGKGNTTRNEDEGTVRPAESVGGIPKIESGTTGAVGGNGQKENRPGTAKEGASSPGPRMAGMLAVAMAAAGIALAVFLRTRSL